MSKDSQLSSSATAPLHIEVDAKALNPEDQPKTIDVAGHKRFLITSALLHWVVNLNLLWPILTYTIDPDFFSSLFINFSHLGNGYDITAGIIVILSLAALSFPQVTRSKFGVPTLLAFFLCHLYIAAFLVRLSFKTLILNYKTLFILYALMIGSSSGSLVACIFSRSEPRRKVSSGIGAVAAILVGVGLYVLMRMFATAQFSFFLYEFALYFIGLAAITGFYVADAKQMITKRSLFYRPTDWMLGGAHFFTDIFFNFWYQAFFVKQKPGITIDTLEDHAAQPDAPVQLDL